MRLTALDDPIDHLPPDLVLAFDLPQLGQQVLILVQPIHTADDDGREVASVGSLSVGHADVCGEVWAGKAKSRGHGGRWVFLCALFVGRNSGRGIDATVGCDVEWVVCDGGSDGNRVTSDILALLSETDQPDVALLIRSCGLISQNHRDTSKIT